MHAIDCPQTSHFLSGGAGNESRHSEQIGTRLAPVSSLSQILQPAGKNTLTTASLASTSHPRTPLRSLAAAGIEERSPITQGESTPPRFIMKERMYARVIR